MIRKLIFLAVVLLISAPVFAQPMGAAWVSRYDGPASAWDKALAIAVDGSGNVYVTGYSTGSGTSWDYLTIKYLPDGDTAWVRRYDGPFGLDDVANVIAVDASGNVYVSGWSTGSETGVDWATVKYDDSGNEVWVRRYNGTSNGEDFATGIAADDLGNVYVTGQGLYEDTNRDYVTIKYGPAGDTLWLRRYDGSDNDYDYATALALDESGYILVTGQSLTAATGFDYASIKYHANGDTAWVRRFTSPGAAWDAALAIAVDSEGNVYVTGQSYLDNTDKDYLTVMYYPNGDTAWTRRYNGPVNGPDRPYDLAVDAGGRVCVTGALRTSTG